MSIPPVFPASEDEYARLHGITLLSPGDAAYPGRILDMSQPPQVLSVLGTATLNSPGAIAIVGTRRMSAYGREMTSRLVRELADIRSDLTIVSGLAYGIDACAHEAALSLGIPTIAVVAHGLGTIYPSDHRDLAARIVRGGGAIVSAYPHDRRPYKGTFLERNGLIAAISRGIIVAESPIKGGAMNTAAHARDLSRTLMALPGRATDQASQGCNDLIRRHHAWLVTSGNEVAEAMGWPKNKNVAKQPELFDKEDTSPILAVLKQEGRPLGIDELVRLTSLKTAELLASLDELEMEGRINACPGAKYDYVG